MNVASVFLDNAARLARAHRASSARTTRCHYIRRPSLSRRLKLVLLWTKMGIHVLPSTSTSCPSPPSEPRSIHGNWINPKVASIQSLRRAGEDRGALRAPSHQLHVSATYRPVIHRARANIQLKEGSGYGWKAG